MCTLLLHRNIHLTLTLKSLCMIRLKGDDEVLINNRHRTFPATYGSIAIFFFFFFFFFFFLFHQASPKDEYAMKRQKR